jgi:hypothetical protein
MGQQKKKAGDEHRLLSLNRILQIFVQELSQLCFR